MLECDGFKMFHGTVKVVPVNGKDPFDVTGTWLFRPEWAIKTPGGIWYCKPDCGGFAASYPPDILDDFREDEKHG